MRLDQLTFTRFIAAIAIVIYHFGKKIYPFNTDLIAPVVWQSYIGVSYFFVLSGFVMVIAYHKNDSSLIQPKTYFVNRFARIYPVYFLALILAIIYCIGASKAFTPTTLALNLTFLHGFIPKFATSINGPAWSLPVEVLFYISFPFLFNRFYKKTNLLTISLVALIVWIASQAVMFNLLYSEYYQGFPSTSHNLIYYFPFMHFNQFMIGSLAALLFLKFKDKWAGNYDIVILILTVVLYFALRFKPQFVDYHNGLLAPLFALIILALCFNTGFFTKIFKHKWLLFLGEISYGVYILQKPIFGILAGVFEKLGLKGQAYLYFSVSLAALLIASSLSYIYFEKPLRNAIKAKFNAKMSK